jgi:tetratricopeptide (TPR) repeat protein
LSAALAIPSTDIPAITASEVDLAWLGDACFGAGLPPAAEREMRAAASRYANETASEAHLRRAVALAPDHPATHIGLYRFYFYRNRLAEALATGTDCLARAARYNGLPADWRQVERTQADFASYSALPRFYLFTLKACAYLHLRLGELDAGSAQLAKLLELDPADRVGGSVLRGVLDRIGQDDDE